MDGDDLDDLAQFIFDPPHLSDNDDADGDNNCDNDRSPGDAAEEADSPSSESLPKRVVRRRARKACIACHKRYAQTLVVLSDPLYSCLSILSLAPVPTVPFLPTTTPHPISKLFAS